ncbi:MAG: hypothetical protein GY906_10285 [bacterium]|nr:hypothetical protein [bacterium]
MSGWIDDLYNRFVHGDDPGELHGEFKERVAEDQARERMTPIPPESMRLLRAFEGDLINDRPTSDYETLEAMGALNQEGNLTPEATRKILDAYELQDRQSS